ncbi:MAG: glycosyltransferase family 4 protein, partial [Trueperaceae bacterium]|nr:glycosyltransferase family 4 protein [Trueperaceae bacterium]
MKVLHVTEAVTEGVARHIEELVQGLSAQGVTSSVLCPGDRADARLMAFLAKSDVTYEAVNIAHWPHPTDLAAIRRLRHRVRDDRFDVVHAHSSKAGLIVRLARAHDWPPIVYSPHGMMGLDPTLASPLRASTLWLERLLLSRCDALVAVSPTEQLRMAELGLHGSRCHVVPLGQNSQPILTRSAARRHLGLAHNEFSIGLVGRLTSVKRPGLALEALEHLEVPVRLFIVGDGPLRNRLEERAHGLNGRHRVTFLGRVDARRIIPALDCLVHPSESESFGLVLLEAAVAGVPTVSGDVGIARTACALAGQGFAIDVVNAEQLAAAVGRIRQSSRLDGKRVAGAERVQAEFTPDAMATRMVSLYATVCARSQRDRRRGMSSVRAT